MLIMTDKRNEARKFEDETVDSLIDRARGMERKNLFFYRQRIGYNAYLIQLWNWHPVNDQNRQPRIIWEIAGVKRTDIKKMREFPLGKPTRPIIKDGRPVRGEDPRP